MQAIAATPKKIALYAAALALAALVVTVLAASFATGSAQAQESGNTAQPPTPCGVNAGKVPEHPDEEFSEGHVALFDAYWDRTTQTLNMNLCPPLAEHTIVTDPLGQVTGIITGRTASNIDINQTVFHAGEDFAHTVTAADKAKYPFLPKVGTKVWWLEQDDPIAEAAEPAGEEEPELVLGLSAGLLKEADWYRPSLDGDTTLKPLQYEFEAERDNEGNVLPFVVFENDSKTPIWDSRDADTNSIEIDPGEYRHYNWVFFPKADQSHTYVLEVHLKGHVRTLPAQGITPAGWKPLTWPKGENGEQLPYDRTSLLMDEIEKTVTSEVKHYTVHVGPLHINEQPRFGAYGKVTAGAAAGTVVVPNISVYGVDGDTLYYKLEGEGADNFKVVEGMLGSWLSVNIAVAENASLTAGDPAYYDLQLKVYDQRDHEDRINNQAIDDTIEVRIQVYPQTGPHLLLQFPNANPQVGEKLRIDAVATGLPIDNTVYTYTVQEGTAATPIGGGEPVITWTTVGDPKPSSRTARFIFARQEAGQKFYKMVVNYTPQGGSATTFESAAYPITWRR